MENYAHNTYSVALVCTHTYKVKNKRRLRYTHENNCKRGWRMHLCMQANQTTIVFTSADTARLTRFIITSFFSSKKTTYVPSQSADARYFTNSPCFKKEIVYMATTEAGS
jgi:hypothetical protein